MNREEIKFRAWDKKHNQMLYGGENWKRYPKWYDVDFITNRGVVIWNKLETRLPFSEGGFEYQQIKINPDILIMQFTGLKDKNGVDIYEGDIITCSATQREINDVIEKDEKVVVQYSDGYFYPFGYNAGWRSSVDDIDIIGNIHESPELLND